MKPIVQDGHGSVSATAGSLGHAAGGDARGTVVISVSQLAIGAA